MATVLKACSLIASLYYVYILLPPVNLYAYQEPGVFITNLFIPVVIVTAIIWFKWNLWNMGKKELWAFWKLI